MLLTISTAGLPVAVSKLVSEANALGRRNQVHKVFRLSLAAFLTLGVVSFLIMYFGSEQLAGMMHDSLAAAGIRALAPAVICVGCLSAFRGYAQGHGRMTPTAVSQILEALCKLTVIGLGLAYWLVRAGQPSHVAAAGAITGVTVGTILALAYMIFNFVSTRMREEGHLSEDAPDVRPAHPVHPDEDRHPHHHQLLHGGHRHRHRLRPGPGTDPEGAHLRPGQLGAVPAGGGLRPPGRRHGTPGSRP